MRIALGQFAAARKGRAAAHRNMRVLAHEQRFEAARLELAREFIDGDAVIRGEIKGANAHGGSRNFGAPHPRRRRPTYSTRPRPMSGSRRRATANGGAAGARKPLPLSL